MNLTLAEQIAQQQEEGRRLALLDEELRANPSYGDFSALDLGPKEKFETWLKWVSHLSHVEYRFSFGSEIPAGGEFLLSSGEVVLGAPKNGWLSIRGGRWVLVSSSEWFAD